MAKLFNLFPTPILKSEPYQLSESERVSLTSGPWMSNRHGNSTSANTSILDQADLAELREFLARQVKLYMREVIAVNSNVEFYITQSWVNMNPKGSAHHSHKHPNSVVSGVFFVDGDSCPLTFQRDNDLFGSFGFNHEAGTRGGVNARSAFKFPNEIGTAVLFPSCLRHEVSPNRSERTRYSLSFNTFVRGELGSVARLNALVL